MPNKILQGNDWSLPGNWNPANEPVTDDAVFISHALNVAVDTGADQGDVDLNLLHIPPEYSKALFASGSPLLIAADKVEHYGSGPLYYACDSNGAAQVTDFVRIQCADASVVTELDSNAAAAGEFSRIVIERGRVSLLGHILFDATCSVIIGYVDNPAGDVVCKILSGADTLPILYQGGGTVTAWNAITTATVLNGTFTEEGTAAVGTLYVARGATVNWNSTGTLGSVVVAGGGTLNLDRNILQKVITTAVWLPGSVVNYKTELVTITNTYDYRRALP